MLRLQQRLSLRGHTVIYWISQIIIILCSEQMFYVLLFECRGNKFMTFLARTLPEQGSAKTLGLASLC